MSHSTFNEHYTSIDYHFGLHEYLSVSNQKLSSVSKMINESVIDGYKDFPEDFWMGATYDNKPIVRMLHKLNKTAQDCFMIISRNE